MSLEQRVLKAYLRRAREPVSKNEVDQWKSDLRKMTKIYKSIPAAEDDKQLELFQEARQLFNAFRQNFEEWVYKRLLPTLDKKTETWAERNVRSEAWDAIAALSGIFPQQWNYKTDLHEDAPWELKRKIETTIRRYQRAFTDAFKAIDVYVEDEQRKGKTPPTSGPRYEKHLVAGVQVLIDAFGRGEDPSLEEDIAGFLSQLDRFAKRIVKAGFGMALEGLTATVAFAESDTLKTPGLVAGKYLAVKDSIEIYPLGFISSDGGTFTHEVGHRFWYKQLSGPARERWSEMFDARTQTITAEDVEEFVKVYLKHTDLGSSGLERLVEQTEDDPVRQAKYIHLVGYSRPITLQWEDIAGLRTWLLKAAVGEKVHVEKISDYATTNPIEAFAEAFRFYVLHGAPALGPWTRWFFQEVARSGGAKLAARVADRYLTVSFQRGEGSAARASATPPSPASAQVTLF